MEIDAGTHRQAPTVPVHWVHRETKSRRLAGTYTGKLSQSGVRAKTVDVILKLCSIC